MLIILQGLNSKSQGCKGGGREEGGKEDRRNAKRGNKSIIELKLYNFRYHRNCFRDFNNKMQINAAKKHVTRQILIKHPPAIS